MQLLRDLGRSNFLTWMCRHKVIVSQAILFLTSNEHKWNIFTPIYNLRYKFVAGNIKMRQKISFTAKEILL